MSITVCLVFAA